MQWKRKDTFGMKTEKLLCSLHSNNQFVLHEHRRSFVNTLKLFPKSKTSLHHGHPEKLTLPSNTPAGPGGYLGPSSITTHSLITFNDSPGVLFVRAKEPSRPLHSSRLLHKSYPQPIHQHNGSRQPFSTLLRGRVKRHGGWGL